MKVLFPTDFSEAADHAFIYALKLADKIDGEVTTAHVYDEPSVRGVHMPNTLNDVYESVALEQFENYKDHIPHLRDIARENNLQHIRVNHAMVRNSKQGTVHAIVNCAKRDKADFIIMGATGTSGLKEMLLGSIAAEVLENAHCPVMVIPNKAQFTGDIQKIAYATQYSAEDRNALKSVIVFANLFNAEVHCVHIDNSHTNAYSHPMEKFKEDFKDHANVHWEVVDHVNVEVGLAEYVDKNNVDVLAMHIKKRNFIQELFTYSITKKMTNHLRMPVLGLHG